MNVRAYSRTAARLHEGVRRLWPKSMDPLATPGPPVAPWCLFGSAVLELHGLRASISDLDVAVDYRLWGFLAGSMSYEVRLPDPAHPPFLVGRDGDLTSGLGEVHIFYAWRADEPEVDLPLARSLSRPMADWPFWPVPPLTEIRKHKQLSLERHGSHGRWAKHQADVAAIDAYLTRVSL